MRDLIGVTICLARPISHGRYHLHKAPLTPRQLTTHPCGLSLGTLNICNSRGSVIVQAIQAVQIGSFDLMILTETNINYQAYCGIRLGYNVVCPLASTTAADGA